MNKNEGVADETGLQAKLRESERRFQALADHAPVGIFETDADGNCTFVNEKWCSLAGMTSDAAHGRGWVAAVHPGDRQKVYEWYAAAKAGREFAADYRFRTPEGKVSWLKGSARALRKDGGQITGYIGTVTDITERMLSEQATNDLAQKLQLVTDALPALISYVDASAHYRFNNRAYIDWFGHRADDIQGKHMRDVLGGEAFTRVEPYVNAALSGQHVQFEAEVPYEAGGKRDIRADYVPHVLPTGRVAGFYALISDVTQHKEAEKHALMLLREVNHRAKNILAVVQAIARQTVQNEDAEKFSARLAALGASQELLVEHDWRGVDLNGLIRSQLGHFDHLLGSRIVSTGQPLLLSPAAAQTLGMALHELATNAAKYGALSIPSGTVRITWALEGVNPARRFVMRWTEQFGPEVQAPRRTGFGHIVITDIAEQGLDADVHLEYATAGIEWILNASATAVLAPKK